MGGPKRRSLFNSEAVFDANVVDVTFKHMIDYAATLGACCPQLSLQIFSTAYKHSNWEGGDAPEILHMVDNARGVWLENKNLAPHDIIEPIIFSKYGQKVPVKLLTDKEIQLAMEQAFIEGLVWGLVNPDKFKRWYDMDKNEKEVRIPEYKRVGLDVSHFPTLSEYVKECERMVKEYEKKMGKLSSIPSKLRNDAGRLGLKI